MANPLQSLNENFLYNSMLARALLQLIAVDERRTLQVWLDKLHAMGPTADELSIRNEYMWFLLLQLQNKRITLPFKKMPPTHTVKPLREILPTHVYEEVLTSTEENMSWMEHAGDKSMNGGNRSADMERPPAAHPAKFMTDHPMPRHGVICYLAAFSDQDY